MKKLNLLLASIGAAALLGGATFALWAVTDNADPIGVKVTPGTLEQDDTEYATLMWGESTELSNVENIKVGENVKVGEVELATDGREYEGVFSITVSQDAKSGAASLKDYVQVTVYHGHEDLGEDGTLPTSEDRAFTITPQYLNPGVKNYTGTSSEIGGKYAVGEEEFEGKFISIFVTLDSGSTPVFHEIKDDVIKLDVDWSPNPEHKKDYKTVYYTKPSGWSNLYAYAWTGSTPNADWPGVKMVVDSGDLYKVEIPNTFGEVIFNDGKAQGAQQTGNISLALWTASSPYWDGDSWESKPIVTSVEYYLIGGFNDWNTDPEEGDLLKLVQNELADVPEFSCELLVDSLDEGKNEFKVYSSDGKWFQEYGDNYKVNFKGNYTFYFQPGGNAAWTYNYIEAVLMDPPVQLVGFDGNFITGEAMEYKKESSEFFIEHVFIDNDDEVKIRAVWNREEWAGFSAVKDDTEDKQCKSLVHASGEHDNIMVNTAGYYDIYWDTTNLGGKCVWIQFSAVQE